MKKFLSSARVKYATLAMVVIATVAIGFNQTRQIAHSDNCPGTAPTKPTFGYWPLSYTGGDCKEYPLVDAKNQSVDTGRDSRYANTAAEHAAGINASVGDSVRVLIYFHNGASDQVDRALTTATNATVSSNFDKAAGTDHTITAKLSADNANTITSAQRGGDITIHTAAPTTLSYIPNTAFLCVRYQAALEHHADLSQTCGWNSTDNEPQILIPISDSIGTAGSYNLGDLKACFAYAGFLMYSVKVNQAPSNPTPTPTPTPSGTPSLSISKTVRNVNAGGTFAKTATAKNGDTVEYQITVTNNGDATAHAVTMNDVLPSGLTQTTGQANNNLGDMAAGASQTVKFQATVNVDNATLVNTATAKGSDTNSVSDTATVTVSTQVTPPPTQTPGLKITKEVRDVNQNGSFATSINANNGDTVEYRLTITNNGNQTLTNVNVSDDLPAGLNYMPTTLASTKGTASSLSNIKAGLLNAGESFTVTFRAVLNQNCGSITNHASAISDQVNGGQASATVNLNCVTTQTTYQIGITKTVKNVTQNTGFQKTVSANNNDRVGFQVVVTNLGTGDLSNVVVTDNLPNGLVFSSGDNMLNGLSIGTLAVGQSRTLYFETTVATSASATLINTAKASSSNTGTVQDTATVFVSQVAGGNVNMVLSKSAFNDTKNVDATRTIASKEDYITYTLRSQNTGNTAANGFVVSDDLSNVLNYADIVDLNGAVKTGSVISWPAETVGAGQTSVHTFRVRVKYYLPARSDLKLVNTYGNTVTINIQQGQVLGAVLIAPTTGANALYYGFAFAGLLTVAFWAFKKKFSIGDSI